jgi:hypothetical protein
MHRLRSDVVFRCCDQPNFDLNGKQDFDRCSGIYRGTENKRATIAFLNKTILWAYLIL